MFQRLPSKPVASVQCYLSALLAVQLMLLGVLVRSESAHDAFHKEAPAQAAHGGHGASHSHHPLARDHHHDSDEPERGPTHEHTAQIIDLLSQAQAACESTVTEPSERQFLLVGVATARFQVRLYAESKLTPSRAPPRA